MMWKRENGFIRCLVEFRGRDEVRGRDEFRGSG